MATFGLEDRVAVTLAGRESRTVSSHELERILRLHAAFVAHAPGGRRAILKFTNLNPLRALTSCELFQVRTD